MFVYPQVLPPGSAAAAAEASAAQVALAAAAAAADAPCKGGLLSACAGSSKFARRRLAQAAGDGGEIPNDPRYPQQWHLPVVDAPHAWTFGKGGAGSSSNQVGLTCRARPLLLLHPAPA
jgi:hypothetical protein